MSAIWRMSASCFPRRRSQAAKDGHERIERFTESLRAQTEHWRLKPIVEAFATLRGIDFVAAVTLVAEIGDFSRFANPREVMAFRTATPVVRGRSPRPATATRDAC